LKFLSLFSRPDDEREKYDIEDHVYNLVSREVKFPSGNSLFPCGNRGGVRGEKEMNVLISRSLSPPP